MYVTDGLNGQKKAMHDLLKELDLPYTIFYTGLFFEFAPHTLSLDVEAGKLTVVGDGKTKLALTKRSEVGQFVAHAVSTAPKSELQWAKIPFEGERLSLLEIAALVEKKTGKKLDVTFLDYEETKKNYLPDGLWRVPQHAVRRRPRCAGHGAGGGGGQGQVLPRVEPLAVLPVLRVEVPGGDDVSIHPADYLKSKLRQKCTSIQNMTILPTGIRDGGGHDFHDHDALSIIYCTCSLGSSISRCVATCQNLTSA